MSPAQIGRISRSQGDHGWGWAGGKGGLRRLQEGCGFPLEFQVARKQEETITALGVMVRSSTGDSEEFITSPLTFTGGSSVNVTFPLLPCLASVFGIVVSPLQRLFQATKSLCMTAHFASQVRTMDPAAQVGVTSIQGDFNGRHKETEGQPGGYLINWGETFIPLDSGSH
jgi:hypothetical protein